MKYFFQDVVVLLAIIFGALVLFCFGLEWALKSQHKSDAATTKNVEEYCSYVTFDGHEYVKYQCGFYQAGFAHSPKCWCVTNAAQKVNQ